MQLFTPPIEYHSQLSRNLQNNIHHKLARFTLFVTIALSGLISSQAFAEDCNDLESNAAWNDGISNLQNFYKNGEYDKALETSKSLYSICSMSPILLYYTGLTLEKKGDSEHALIYYQKASESTTHMATSSNISRQIWYQRYEAEHPERTEEAVSALTKHIEEQVLTINEQKTQTERHQLQVQALYEQKAAEMQTLMWTGVGVAGAGVAFIATGATLLGADKKPLNDLKENPKRVAGWILLGTGIGMAVAGGIMAGISGWQYSKAKEDAVMTVSATPFGASFSMTF